MATRWKELGYFKTVTGTLRQAYVVAVDEDTCQGCYKRLKRGDRIVLGRPVGGGPARIVGACCWRELRGVEVIPGTKKAVETLLRERAFGKPAKEQRLL